MSAVPERIVVTGAEARKRIVKGALFLSDTVKQTLGPWGTNALFEKGSRITNDGVSIAREIQLKDEIEHLGARKIQEVASKTNDEVGDGTTTAITIAGAILKEATEYFAKDETTITNTKSTADVVAQIEAERKEITEKLVAMATPITSEEQLVNVATVSVEDKTLGELIGKAQWELGAEGYLLAVEVNERECSVERVNGIRIDNGFGTSMFINNPEKEALELEDARVVITNHTIQSILPLKAVMEQLSKMGVNKVALVARGFTTEAIQECAKNIAAGFHIAPINAPYTDQAELMGDMAAILGGTFINSEARSLDSIQISDIGFAKEIVAKRYYATFTGQVDEEATTRISDRVENLEKKLEGTTSDFEKRNLKGRIAQLKNGFSLIKVGGMSETERGYKKDKVDDAVNAVRAGLQEGVVPGAGQALNTIAQELPDTYILKQPLMAVYSQIMSTAPLGTTIPEWVQDPVKVIRIALEKACSVASTLATTTIAISTEKPKTRYVQEVTQSEED